MPSRFNYDGAGILPSLVAVRIMELLAPSVGKFTAQRAVIDAAKHQGVPIAHVRPQHVNAIAGKLTPVLRTISGASCASEIIDSVRALGLPGADRTAGLSGPKSDDAAQRREHREPSRP